MTSVRNEKTTAFTPESCGIFKMDCLLEQLAADPDADAGTQHRDDEGADAAGGMDADETEQELTQLQNLLNSAGLNSIGNMVLLDLRINRSYGNADYAHKRTIIFQEYMNQKYVRPHTLAVFMKGDIDAREATGIPLNRWTLEDIKRNTDKIAKEIGKNFNAWLTQNN